jgi:hypothetical protein
MTSAYRIVIRTGIKMENAWRHINMLQAFFHPKIRIGWRFPNLQEYPENKLLK